MIRSDVTILHFVNELTLFHHPVDIIIHHHTHTRIASMNTAKSVVSHILSIVNDLKLIARHTDGP